MNIYILQAWLQGIFSPRFREGNVSIGGKEFAGSAWLVRPDWFTVNHVALMFSDCWLAERVRNWRFALGESLIGSLMGLWSPRGREGLSSAWSEREGGGGGGHKKKEKWRRKEEEMAGRRACKGVRTTMMMITMTTSGGKMVIPHQTAFCTKERLWRKEEGRIELSKV